VKYGWQFLKYPAIFVSLAAFWIFSISNAGLVRAQDAHVNIEPRESSGRTVAEEKDRASANFSVNSNLVLIPVLVTDREERLVTGLHREHFRIWDNKVEQVITHFASDDLPVSTGLVFDCSGSMGSKLKKSHAAVAQFLAAANPEDEFSLVKFSDQAELAERFTSRTEDIENRVMFTVARGRTALLDAIALSMSEMKHARHARKAILIISDGGDNSSRYTVNEVKRMVREGDVQIYAIGIMDPLPLRTRSPEEMAGAALLSDISEQTGGRLFEIADVNELPDVAVRIGTALRHEYVLGYAPDAAQDGKYHHVQVKVVQPKGLPALRTSFRTGYVAPLN
jgi:VWFA-related protein